MINKNDNLIAYFKESISFLSRFKWIYDFQTIELFNHSSLFTQQFPNEWIEYFKKLNSQQLKELFTSETYAEGTPISLKSFLNESNRLLSLKPPVDLAKQPLKFKTKKQHEIDRMLPFISELCIKHDCQYVIDIGSGLGYFDRLLVNNCPNLTVIAIEKNEEFNAKASKQNSDVKAQIINMSYTIDKDSCQDLIPKIKQLLNKPNANLRMGLISLHSCGDLTPNMLKIFNANREDLKFITAFSCCYHSMQPLNDSIEHEEKTDFFNFPMSNALKQTDAHFRLSLFGLRLACQQNILLWKEKSDQEHTAHIKQVAYRAVLQKYCYDSKNFLF